MITWSIIKPSISVLSFHSMEVKPTAWKLCWSHTESQVIGWKYILSASLGRRRLGETVWIPIGPGAAVLSVYTHLICFHLHGEHRLITAIITASPQLGPPSYLPINLQLNTRRCHRAGNHGNEISCWFGESAGGRSAARVKWKDDCGPFGGAVHLLADAAGSIPQRPPRQPACIASALRQRRREYEGRWCSPWKGSVNKLLWKCPSVMSFCHNQFPITRQCCNAYHNIPHTHAHTRRHTHTSCREWNSVWTAKTEKWKETRRDENEQMKWRRSLKRG